MALSDHVKARFGGSSSQYLANLTQNFDSDGAGSIDDAVLLLAVNDVIADMEILAGEVYDDSATTNPDDYAKHIATGVQCVIIKLQFFTGKTPDKIAKWLTERYEKLMVALSKVTSRDRFLIQTSSPYEPSDQAENGPILPPFDEDLMRFFIPDSRDGFQGNNGTLRYP